MLSTESDDHLWSDDIPQALGRATEPHLPPFNLVTDIHPDSAKFKLGELFTLPILLTKSVVFSPTPTDTVALWTPSGCPTIPFHSDTNYPELAETPKVKGSVL